MSILMLLILFTVRDLEGTSFDGLQTRTRLYTFEVSYIYGAPDGVMVDHVLAINGQSPGPAIRGNVGDKIVVRVLNHIQDGQNVSMHWHGIHQRGTPFEDGSPFATQCQIRNGGEETYSFVVDRPGTYWYHSHTRAQYTEGLYGPLIVSSAEDPYRKEYDEELIIFMNEWYHIPAKRNIEWLLTSKNRTGFPYPDSLLLNGRGRYPCNLANEGTCRADEQLRHVYLLNPFRKYRLRFINVGGIGTFKFSIDHHDMQVIEADGGYVANNTLAKALMLGPSQRVSVILHQFSLTLRNFHYGKHPSKYEIQLSIPL